MKIIASLVTVFTCIGLWTFWRTEVRPFFFGDGRHRR